MLFVLTFTVPEYEISSPTYHNFQPRYSRWRRSSENLKEKHEFGLGINAFRRAFNLSLSHNKHLLAPSFKIEILRQNGTDVSKKSVENCHHYTGSVHQGGSAAISHCGGLVCAFRWFLCWFRWLCFCWLRWLCLFKMALFFVHLDGLVDSRWLFCYL